MASRDPTCMYMCGWSSLLCSAILLMLMMGLKLCIVPLDVLFWVTGATRGKKKEKGTAIRTGDGG